MLVLVISIGLKKYPAITVHKSIIAKKFSGLFRSQEKARILSNKTKLINSNSSSYASYQIIAGKCWCRKFKGSEMSTNSPCVLTIAFVWPLNKPLIVASQKVSLVVSKKRPSKIRYRKEAIIMIYGENVIQIFFEGIYTVLLLGYNSNFEASNF